MDIIISYHSSVVSLEFKACTKFTLFFAHLVYSSMVSWSLIIAESIVVNCFHVPKSGEEESKLLLRKVFPNQPLVQFFLFAFHAMHGSRYPIKTPIQITSDLDMQFYCISAS